MMRILTVGDGDLSLSLALIRAYGSSQIDLVASTLVPCRQELCQTYPHAAQVLRELTEEEQHRVPVLYGVDATQLHRNRDLLSNGEEGWNVILFHHPHLGLDTLRTRSSEEYHAHRHFVLLCHYFWSARNLLLLQQKSNHQGTRGSSIHVCLCQNQPQTWRVQEAAERQGLRLCHDKPIPTSNPRWLCPSLSWPLSSLKQDDDDNVEQQQQRQQQPLTLLPVQPHYPAPRRFRNGKLGSKHVMGKYGYRHQRTHGSLVNGGGDIHVDGSLHYFFAIDPSTTTINPFVRPNNNNTDAPQQQQQQQQLNDDDAWTCLVCGSVFESKDVLEQHMRQPALPDPFKKEEEEE